MVDVKWVKYVESDKKTERFPFECRKIIGFASTTLHDWLKKLAPISQAISSKTKTNLDSLALVSRALCRLHVITSSVDWFSILSVSF